MRPRSARLPEEPLELYTLDGGISESHNLAQEHPDLITEFESRMQAARTESPNWPIGARGAHG